MGTTWLLVALFCGFASGARITGRSPSWVGTGTTLTITGTDFSADQFNEFDATKGNFVQLVNDGDAIDCETIRYLSSTSRIVCSVGKRVNTKVSDRYNIKVFVDGVEASGSKNVRFGGSPSVNGITPKRALSGSLTTFTGAFKTDKYKVQPDAEEITETDVDSGKTLTKLYLGFVECEMINETSGEMFGEFTTSTLTCLPKTKKIGALTSSLYVTEAGASTNSRMESDSLDNLFQHQTYPAVESVSPATGSIGGKTLITVEGVGFNPAPGATDVRVGGAECEIQTISDDTLTCMTPAESQTKPGPRHRGMLFELWSNTSIDIAKHDEMDTLDSSHPNYTSETIISKIDFDVELSSMSVGKLTGYFHPPHTGVYGIAFGATKGVYILNYFGLTGNPDNLTRVHNWANLELEKDSPIYMDVRFKAEESTRITMYLNDFDAKYTWSDSSSGQNEKQRASLTLGYSNETQTITPTGSPVESKLYLNGRISSPVDVSNADKVKEALLDLVEQKCDMPDIGQKLVESSSYEDGQATPTGMHSGSIVNDIEPYCGRHSFNTHRTNPRIYYQSQDKKRVDLHEYPYVCFAVKGDIEKESKITARWRDKWNNWRQNDFWFEIPFTATKDKWSYQCYDVLTAIQTSWIANSYKNGAIVLVSVYAPKTADEKYYVYTDEFSISSHSIEVRQTHKSALYDQGILITDINVTQVEMNNVTSLQVEFFSSNCEGNYPLIGVTDGEADPSWLTSLDNPASYQEFAVSGGSVIVNRTITGSNAPQGTWDMTILEKTISAIPVDVGEHDLDALVEAALGTSGIKVSKGGTCYKRYWDIEFTEDPGRKPMMSLSSNINYDGDSLTLEPIRRSEGRLWHHGLGADFVTTFGSNEVSVTVDGYHAICSGDCNYEYSSSGVPTLSSVAGTSDASGSHTLTIIGTDFTSTTLSDYTVTAGSNDCAVSSVSMTSVICTTSYLSAGTYDVAVAMQPVGAADPVLSYQVSPSIDSVSPTTGGTGGGYSITITGSGFPSDMEGWTGNSVSVGGAACEITDASDANVICVVPAGTAGAQNVSVTISTLTTTNVNGFTFDASLSATVTSATPLISSVLGGDVLTLSGSDFGNGTDGYVKVGTADCNVTSWTETEIECTLPANNPGDHDIHVYTGIQGFASGSHSVSYNLKITGTSATSGSVYGGTILVIAGEGFGTDCSNIQIAIGERMVCDVLDCSDTQITCITQLVKKTHYVTNMGSLTGYGKGYAWSPKLVTAMEGDDVIISWDKTGPFSELLYNIYSIDSPTDVSYNGKNFHSGERTSSGSIMRTFYHKTTFYYGSDAIFEVDAFNIVTMTGAIDVVRHHEAVNKISMMVGKVQAPYEPLGASPSVTVDGCTTLITSSFVDCNSTAPSVPATGDLYFTTDLCLTPVVTGVAASSTENIPGLDGIQVRSGATLTITGTGFGTETCQTTVNIGPASCNVTASSDTSVTCVLDDLDNIVSMKPYRVDVTVANRGLALNDIDNYCSEGQVTVVPVLSSFSPDEGSTAGGTLITILGSGFNGFDGSTTVTIGSDPCAIESITATQIECLTAASPATTAPFSMSVSGTAPISALSNPTYTYSESLTPTITSMNVSGDTINIYGTLFGTSASDVTIIVTPLNAEKKRQSDEEPLHISKKQVRSPIDMNDDLDEMEEYMYADSDEIDDDNVDAQDHYHYKARRSKTCSIVYDDIDFGSDFWGKFTNTQAKSYEESKRLGAWKIGGSIPQVIESKESLNAVEVKVKRQLRNLPMTCTPSTITSTSMSCTIPDIAAGSHAVTVSVNGLGNAAAISNTVTILPTITSISPTEGSTNGGALLTISGIGFTPGDISVTIGGNSCSLENESTNSIECRVPAHVAGSETVTVTTAGVSEDSTDDFTYSSGKTPIVTSVSPASGVTQGMTLTLSGSQMKFSATNPMVYVGGESCVVTSATDTEVTCTSPDLVGESHTILLSEDTYGDSNDDISVTYSFTVTSVTPDEGGFAGIPITVAGTGFDPNGGSMVTVCGETCDVTSYSSDSISCNAPPSTGMGTTEMCDVIVTNPDSTTQTQTNGFTYKQTLTPSVTSVAPKRGGTAGGTTLTITGSSFASTGNVVTIDGSPCNISAENVNEITCVTEAHVGSGKFPVKVEVPGSGFATTNDDGIFYYIDRWSSTFTWGGLHVPADGELVEISQGNTILLDETSAELVALIINGGHLVFDNEASAELVLHAGYILVVNGGSLSIGSEEEPLSADKTAVIELHGNTQSYELPFYGAKVLAVREGTLNLHGAHIPNTWTYLSATADAGDDTITLTSPATGWKAGDQIVIATTELRFSKNENEEKTIASVSGDGLTLTLTEPLEYQHVSISQTLGGRTIETRAEVGLLTRNVKIRGNVNSEFTETVEACDADFDPGQFKTQTCFNGRYGEELISDQFGATVMIFGEAPNQDLVSGQIEYVEVSHAGQAFQLGRYPLHFHLVGNVNTSYIRGCAIHHTFNRAVTIHAADNLTVERNVAYNNMGHAIFTEDGNEQNNVIQYNLAVFTRTSASLLNVDITPSSFWVVHPNNIVRHNAAAGGTHFGYWYRLEEHPTGPSATTSICQNHAPMGQFYNNTAHSMGWYGLWVFSMDGYFPQSLGCNGGEDEVAAWYDFTVWKCERGAEVVFGGSMQFHNFVALDNEKAGLEMVKVDGPFGSDGPGIFDSMVVGHSDLCDLDPDCSPSVERGGGDGTVSGIIGPKMKNFNIDNCTFVNFDSSHYSALSGCSQCKPRQGGFTIQTSQLTFDNAAFILRFLWEYETLWLDADGTLCGAAECNVVPTMGILPSGSCQMDVTAFSGNPSAPGSVCSGLKFLRFTVSSDIEPSSLQAQDLIVSNAHGNTSVPYFKKRLTTAGWMGILFTEDSYDWEFDYASQITNLTYHAETSFLEVDDYYFVTHNFIQRPDSFATLGGQQNSTDALPDPNVNVHGDYYWNNDTREMTYLVKGSASSKKRNMFESREVGNTKEIDFKVYRCFFTDCITPTPPPVPTGRPDISFRWSDKESWKEVPVGSGGHPDEFTYDLPVEGDEIIIPAGMWLIVDTETPKLGRVYVYGGLEFEDTRDHTFEATIIFIQGGTVVAGFSEDAPFANNLNIILRGSIDPNDPDNVDMPMPIGVPSVGWKAIGVFGQLSLHGDLTGDTWIKLGATALAGQPEIILAEAADSSWLNKEVMITTTTKEVMETEIKTVIAVSGTTLTLDSNLQYDHLGEDYTVSDGSVTFNMAGEVGLLSRNIVVEGNDYPDLQKDSFGGRIVVSQLNAGGINYEGRVKLSNVELKNMGQEGFTDTDDPRYALAFVGLNNIKNESYVKRCSFNKIYNTAIGLFGTDNVTVEENVIYHTVGPCIRDDASDNTFKDNLVSVMLFPGTYNGRNEPQNMDWFGAFALNEATGVVLEGNVVAGSEQAGYQTFGEMCEDNTLWENNEVHGAMFGVMVWHRGGSVLTNTCRRINDFYAWRMGDTAFYYQHFASFLLTNVQAVDCPVGVNSIIYSPPSLSHVGVNKEANIKDSIFVAASTHHTCDYQNSEPDIYVFLKKNIWKGSVKGGSVASVFASFASSNNMAPKHGFHDFDSYPALFGKSGYDGVVFVNYGDRSCGSDVVLYSNKLGDDAIHPIFTNNLTFIDTPTKNYIYLQKPNVGAVNPSDCVDMDCDGHKKVIITDEDGSLLGVAGATATAQAEFEWDGDARRGVGDYRIPVALKQKSDGSLITAPEKYPNKGIVRDDSCTFNRDWRAWICTAMTHRMMIIESMDSDTEIRRLSPIALIANPGTNGYVDLINGPMDRGWCFGYTCQERISTFYSVVANGYTYEMALTSTPPGVIRFQLLHSHASETVLLRMFFPKPQRYDIHVDGTYIPPTNIDQSSTSYQLLTPDPLDPEAFFPKHSDVVGTNYHQRNEKFVHVLLRGGHEIEIRTTPLIVLSTGVVVDSNTFYAEDLVNNIAALLGVSKKNIRVTNIIREDSRKRSGTEEVKFEAEIGSAPGNFAGDVISREKLTRKAANFVNKVQLGESELTFTEVEILPIPEAPEEPGPPASPEFGSQTGTELFSDKQQQENAAKLNQSLTAEVFKEVGALVMKEGIPNSVKSFTPLSGLQLGFETSDGEPLEEVGLDSHPWQVKVSLIGGPDRGLLLGTKRVPFKDGTANFTDLSVNHVGKDYTLMFDIVYPRAANHFSVPLGHTFVTTKKRVSLAFVSFPQFVNRMKKFSLRMALIDEDTGTEMDPSMLVGQKLTGKIKLLKSKQKKGTLKGSKRFTAKNGDIASFFINGLIMTHANTNFRLMAKAIVRPAGWKISVKSEVLDVLPKKLMIPEDAVTKEIEMVGLRGKGKKIGGREKQFANALRKVLAKKIGISYWHDINVVIPKKPVANLKVTGSALTVDEAIEALCEAMKEKRLKVKVKKQEFSMSKLRVEGKRRWDCDK